MPPSFSPALLLLACCLLAAVLSYSVRIWTRLRTLPGPESLQMLVTLRDDVAHLSAALERVKSERRFGRNSVTRGSRSHRIDRAEETAIAGPTLIAVPDLANTSAAGSSATEELGRRFGPIWALADSGLSAEAIAERLGQPIGQVELILGLRRQLGSSRPTHVSSGNRN